MKRFRWLILLVILAVFGLIMLTVPFHVASSKTNTSTQFNRSSANNSNAERDIDTSRVFLHVENRVGVGSALAWALRRHLEEAGFTVVLLNNEPGPDDYPLLLADIRDKHALWTPFYASADLRVVSRYASYTSDIALDNNESIHFDGSDSQGAVPIQMRMTAEVSNSTIGLVTLPAHRRILVDEPASDIAEYVRNSIDEALEKARESESNE
jgi:hypothetical protein